MASGKGEENVSARLTETEVYAIRRDTRRYKQIAYEYGIAVSHVSNIRNRRKWAHLPEEEKQYDTESAHGK
jgi:hypothetical protein